MGSMMGGGVTVEIYGDDTDTLKEISDEIENQLSNIEGTREITSSLERTDTQIAIKLDKDKIRQYGLTGSAVASQIKNTVSGYTATTLKSDGTEMDINIAFPEERVSNLVNIEDMSILTNGGYSIPLSSVAEITMDDVPSSISRKNQQEYVTVSCDLYGTDSGTVGNQIQSILSQMNMPDGYSATLGGTNEMMNDTFSSLGLVIILAIVLVYMVMAAQFESLVNPFVIMFTIPLAFTGAILLLFIFGESINMMALIGCLVLVGIVVNNGIVLISAPQRAYGAYGSRSCGMPYKTSPYTYDSSYNNSRPDTYDCFHRRKQRNSSRYGSCYSRRSCNINIPYTCCRSAFVYVLRQNNGGNKT